MKNTHDYTYIFIYLYLSFWGFNHIIKLNMVFTF